MELETIVKRIIEEQSLIVGKALAQNRAVDSGVIRMSDEGSTIEVTEKNPDEALRKIIDSYRILFGPASVAVCVKIIKEYYNEDRITNLLTA